MSGVGEARVAESVPLVGVPLGYALLAGIALVVTLATARQAAPHRS